MPESCHVMQHVPSALYLCLGHAGQVKVSTEDLPREAPPAAICLGHFTRRGAAFFRTSQHHPNPSHTLKLPTRHQSSDDEAEEHQLCHKPRTINFLNKTRGATPRSISSSTWRPTSLARWSVPLSLPAISWSVTC